MKVQLVLNGLVSGSPRILHLVFLWCLQWSVCQTVELVCVRSLPTSAYTGRPCTQTRTCCTPHIIWTCEKRGSLLPISLSQDCSSRGKHPELRTPCTWEWSWKPTVTQSTSSKLQQLRLRKKRTTQEEQPKYTICLPYVAGVGENLRRVCRKFDIRTVFTTMSTLR